MLGFINARLPLTREVARLCRDGGREKIETDKFFGFSLPQFRFAQQLPRQREPNYTPTFAKEPQFNVLEQCHYLVEVKLLGLIGDGKPVNNGENTTDTAG